MSSKEPALYWVCALTLLTPFVCIVQEEYEQFRTWTAKNNPQGKADDKKEKKEGDKKDKKEGGKKKK